jgi:hypothetical protein
MRHVKDWWSSANTLSASCLAFLTPIASTSALHQLLRGSAFRCKEYIDEGYLYQHDVCERIHVLLGRAYAHETAVVSGLFSGLWEVSNLRNGLPSLRGCT